MDVILQPLFRSPPSHGRQDADDPLTLETGSRNLKYSTIAARLEKLFGLGDNSQLRRKLYFRIQKSAMEHGPECYDVIRACVASAQSADYPDRYFCTAVTSELKNLEYWEKPVDF